MSGETWTPWFLGLWLGLDLGIALTILVGVFREVRRGR